MIESGKYCIFCCFVCIAVGGCYDGVPAEIEMVFPPHHLIRNVQVIQSCEFCISSSLYYFPSLFPVDSLKCSVKIHVCVLSYAYQFCSICTLWTRWWGESPVRLQWGIIDYMHAAIGGITCHLAEAKSMSLGSSFRSFSSIVQADLDHHLCH